VEERGIGAAVVIMIIVAIAASVAICGYYLVTHGGEFKTYTNEKYSFKFDYPVNWDFREYTSQDAVRIIAIENALENRHRYQKIIQITVYDKTAYENYFGISLDNLTAYISSLENMIEKENYVLIGGRFFIQAISPGKPVEITIDNHSGVRFSATSTIENITIRFQVELVVKDNYFYEFVMVTSEESYSIYEPIFEHVIDSFSFLG